MKKIFPILLVILLATIFLVQPVYAGPSNPVGSCPPSFELHPFMDHTGEHMHRHIGVDRDLNGDGFICMRMLPNNLHLHVDNSKPLP